MKFKNIPVTLFAIIAFIYGCKKSSPTENQPVTQPTKTTNGWTLVWSDEFNYNGLPDSTKWTYDVGNSGWGNKELEYYTRGRLKNARVQDSVLIIEADSESYQGSNYTSARLVSIGTGNWTYGRFEVKAMLPYGRGTWPAIWMLPTQWTYGNGGWPDNGEIDIMEHVGYDPEVIHASIHCDNSNATNTLYVKDATAAFHVYALEWSPDTISIFVDSTKYFTFLNNHSGYQSWPFDKDFHFILNLAVGGTWGGLYGVDPTVFPQKMIVDYVRAYKKSQ